MHNAEHILTEIKDNIAKKDAIKASLVMEILPQTDVQTRLLALNAFHAAPADFAVPLLARYVTEHQECAESVAQAREVLAVKILAMPVLVTQALKNQQTPFRWIYIAMAGELKLESIVPDLIEAVLATTDVDEIRQLIGVLGEIGDPEATNTLSDFLYSGNRTLTIAAIKALGKMGTPTAMLRLAERMGSDNQLDALILDIFSRVQDAVALDKLNESMRSHYAHLRTHAKKALVNIGAKSVPVLTQNLLFDDPDLQIHTLNVLGDIGDAAAIGPIRKLLHTQPKNANVRFAAYEALGLLPLEKGAYVLTQGLSDPVEHVCIAAAKAIDANFNEILAGGIKNLAAERDEDAHRIMKTVINAQAKHIFLSLVFEPRFQNIALLYLDKAHQDTRDFFYTALKEKGHTELALRLLAPQEKAAQETRPQRRKICAVDDSRMILNIYKSTLHELGYEPVLFEFPASALEWLHTEKPDLVLTDLNMPDITGIELTRRVRQMYRKEQLPVIMITTQNEKNDNQAAFEAGVSDIMHKPFTADTLRTMINKHSSPN
ncbi:hypothetical protein MASR1M90_23440 [Desulfovibrionales bacterium]